MNRRRKNSAWAEVAEISLVFKPKVKPSMRPQVCNSQDAYDLLMEFWDMDLIELQEQAKIILLNRSNRVLGVHDLGTGGISASYLDARIIFATALKAAASGVIIAHNHPSGNLQPSKYDISLTQKLHQSGKLLGIEVWDHLIVGREGYFSLGDEGVM